ncbi:MAG TPA: ABC transporter permease [Opitutaceae bacterium]|jgi:spermidine/putrescine transport system permease protein
MTSRTRPVDRLLKAWTAAVLLFLYAPIAVLVAYSFNASRLNILWRGFTLRWYAEIWHNTKLVRAACNSLEIAAAATAASIVLGTTGAWLLHRYRFRGSAAIKTLVAIPMVMPEVLMGISLLVFFTAIRFSLGFTTVIVGHVTFCIPFVMSAVQARLDGIDPSLEEAALDLGATPVRAFWHIILPFLRPAIVAGGLMAFTLSLDELIVTFFTASSASRTLPLEVFGMAKIGLNPELNALSAIIVMTAAGIQVALNQMRKDAR